MSEAIFEKERKASSKPLTKKQKEALAKGRAKLKEKRKLAPEGVDESAIKVRQKNYSLS